MIFAGHPRPYDRRPSGAGRPAALLLALASLASPTAAQESPRPLESAGQRLDAAALMTVLLDSTAAGAAREAAADRLVEMAQRPEISRSLTALFQGEATAKDAPDLVLAAIARAWEVPPRLGRPLLDAADRADPHRAPVFMPAVAALRTPDAARALVRFLGPDRPPAVRASAADSLARMTGRDDLADDPGAWRDWLERARGLSVQQWDHLLAEGVWRRAQRLETDRRALTDRLTDGYRRLYLALPATPGDERLRLLTQMLSGPRPELRDLGLEIVSREVASGNVVDAAVSDAAFRLLVSPDASVRAKAAALVVQFPSSDGGRRLAQALVTESDTAAAAQMLVGLARWPDPMGREAALRWLENGSESAPPAAEAVLSLYREGLLSNPADQERALTALRQIPIQRLTPAACHLLVAFGQDQDRAQVASLLTGPSDALRQGAADALTGLREFLDQILAAAQGDPALFGAAVDAVCAGRPSLDGYAALEALPAPTPSDRHDGLLRAASALSTADMIRVAHATADLSLRVAMLSRLTEHGPALPTAASVGEPAATAAGIMLLARTQLEMKRPDLAVAALEALPDTLEGVDPAQVLRTRTVALLWSNRIEDAGALDATPSAWLDGLERAIGEPHALLILKSINERFTDRLSAEDAQRLRTLGARVAATRTSADGETPGDRQGPG